MTGYRWIESGSQIVPAKQLALMLMLMLMLMLVHQELTPKKSMKLLFVNVISQGKTYSRMLI